MKGGKTSNYQNGGVDPRQGTQRDPGRKTNVRKLKAYQFYTPEEKREQYKYWDKEQPGGRQYNNNELPLDENHPDYGTSNWKYLTDPDRRKREEARGIKYVFDNKGRLVRLSRKGSPMGGTRAQRNERNITPKGPQEETIKLDKREVKKIPTPSPKLPPRPEKRPIETKVSLDKKEVKKIPTTQDDKLPSKPGPGAKEDETSFGDAFKAARAEGEREFEYPKGSGKMFHTRRADETQEQYDAKFPTDKAPKAKTAAEATQEGRKSVEKREKEKTAPTTEPKADMGDVKLTPKMQEDRDKPKETSTLTDTKDTDIEDTFVSADPKPAPAPKPEPEEDPTRFDPDKNIPRETKAENTGETKEETKEEDKTDDSNTEARRGAIVRANKKKKTMPKRKRKLTPMQTRARDFLNNVKSNRAKLKTNTPGRKMRKGGFAEASDSYENGGKVSPKDREKAGKGKGPGPKFGTREFAKNEARIMRDRNKDRNLPTFRKGYVTIGQFDKEGNKRYNLTGDEPKENRRNKMQAAAAGRPMGTKEKMAKAASVPSSKMEEGGNVKVKLHKDDDKKTIGDTNLTLSGDFGVDAAKKNVANKQNNEKKESTDKNANQQPKKEEKRGNYRGGSDTPQVMRDKNINRNRGNRTNNDSDDSSTDSPTRPARKTRLTREERFDLRQRRKDKRLADRLEKKRQKENRRKYRKESRQYRRTIRRKGRQERRESRGVAYSGGRRISPRRWYKNLKDKLGLESIEGRGRLKNYDDFKTSRTQMPVRQYKGGGMIEGAADSYKHGGMLKKPNNKGLKKLPRSVRNKMGYMQDGGKTPTKETGRKNWMQKAKERMGAKYERFKEKGRQKPYTKSQWYNEGYGSFPKQRSAPDYKDMRRMEMKKKNNPDKFTKEDQMYLDYAKSMVNKGDKKSYDVYRDYNKKVQDKSQKAYDQKKESFRQEDIKDRKNRKRDSENVKQKTTRTMPMKMQDGGKAPREFKKLDKNSRYDMKITRETPSKTISDEEVKKFLDDKYNRRSTRSGKKARPNEPRGVSKEGAKYAEDMKVRKSEVSKIKGQKKPTKPQMKKMLRTSTGRTLLRRMGYLGLALSLFDVGKGAYENRKNLKPSLKKRAKSGNPNMGRKI